MKAFKIIVRVILVILIIVLILFLLDTLLPGGFLMKFLEKSRILDIIEYIFIV